MISFKLSYEHLLFGGSLLCCIVGWITVKWCKPREPSSLCTSSNLPISTSVFSLNYPSHHWAEHNIIIIIIIIIIMIQQRMSTNTLEPYWLSCNSPTYSTFSTLDDAFHAGLKNNYLVCCSIVIQVGCTQNINTSKRQKTEFRPDIIKALPEWEHET